ncbi:unnamed protein product [Owenia fusiformis]|uniref:Uncharacterized protein n=1 Tax=Owenia fusiformis TaxID=6347 RepID=A0A8J1YAT4_OWEFU|nr:unnamed protein product [Owenia fusiformis]
MDYYDYDGPHRAHTQQGNGYRQGYPTGNRYDNGAYDNPDTYQGLRYPSGGSMDHDDEPDTLGRTKLGKRGKLVTFYRNGDNNFKGFQTSINSKIRSLETLLVDLTSKIPTTTGIRYIFTWPDCKEVRDLSEFEGGRSYIASCVKKVNKTINYGSVSREQFWQTKKPSAGRHREDDKRFLYNIKPKQVNRPPVLSRMSAGIAAANETPRETDTSDTFNTWPRSQNMKAKNRKSRNFQDDDSVAMDYEDTNTRRSGSNGDITSPNQKPTPGKVLTVVNNLNRQIEEKVMFNPGTTQEFEEIMEDISDMMKIPQGAFTGLFAGTHPFKKIESFSQLLRTVEKCDKFIACSLEGVPQEILKREREAPSSNSSNDSTGMRKPRKHSRRYENLEIDSMSSPEQMSRHESTEDRLNRAKLLNVKPVTVDIHGLRREFYAPSKTNPEDNGAKPDKKLKLEWVYGYRGQEAKNNLYVLRTGELVYYVATVAIVYDKEKETQKHYMEHTEDITCMALHPTQNYVATGQQVGSSATAILPHIRIWDAKSLYTYKEIGLDLFQYGINTLAFSTESGGDLLLAVDASDRHVLSVWDWQAGTLTAKTTPTKWECDYSKFATTSEVVISGCFYPQDDTIIITYGRQHIFFWKIFQDSKIYRDKKSGVFNDEVPKFVTSVAFAPNGDVISGDSNGSILIWSRNDSDQFAINRHISDHMSHAHHKSVFALCMKADGILLSGAGSEIKAWDTSSEYRFIKERMLPDTAGTIRNMLPHNQQDTDGQLYIGTANNSILEGSLQNKFTYLIQGHHKEVSGLTCHPTEQTFITAGLDKEVCKWALYTHNLIWKSNIGLECVCVAFDPQGLVMAIGTTAGRFVILDSSSGNHVASIQVGNDDITTISFSPDGKMLAAGCQDNIFLYQVLDDGQCFRKHKTGVLSGHSNYIRQLDWSTDSRYIQSVSADYDLMYWDIGKMQCEKQGALLRDSLWTTQSATLGHALLGAWSNLEKDEDIVCTARSNKHITLAVGDNTGSLRLYKYPCSKQKADFIAMKPYSKSTNNVCYTNDDTFLITSGGSDAGLMQWCIKDNKQAMLPLPASPFSMQDTL